MSKREKKAELKREGRRIKKNPQEPDKCKGADVRKGFTYSTD